MSVKPKGTCRGPKCVRAVHAKGLCKTHGAQARSGKPLTPIRDHVVRGRFIRCTFAGCDRPHSSKGLCATHYDQTRKGRTLRLPRSKAKTGEYPETCTYGTCNGVTHVRGLCVTHYGRGISQHLRDAVLRAQGGRCLCGDTDAGPSGTWHLDHDHSCTQHGHASYCQECIRGLLCRDCNVKGLSWYEAKRASGMAPMDPLETWVHRRVIVTGDPWLATVQVRIVDIRSHVESDRTT